jgi:precorrin-3B synthase
MNVPLCRGACPGLSAPMQTGDGLLVRLLPIGTMPFRSFAELCAAAGKHGNGVIEITARGSIQVRGLSAASAPQFAAAVAALGIAVADGNPILSNALAGLDPEELLDAGALAAELRHALARTSLAARLAPKVAVAIDGGGALALDRLPADLRLCAWMTDRAVTLQVALGGDATSATPLGAVAPDNGVEAAIRLLSVLARGGRQARARDVLASQGIAVFQSAIADLLVSDGSLHRAKTGREAIGFHPLRDGSFACGIGLAFGHADATSLRLLADAAGAAGASGLRAAADRALMAIGIPHEKSASFAAAAEQLGFIVRAGDPRRRVVACAGRPICGSAHIATRTIAPRIAAIAAPSFDGAFTIHISGCIKGCAHPGAAALTVLGTPEGCALIANGTTRDNPHILVEADEMPAAIARELKREHGHV